MACVNPASTDTTFIKRMANDHHHHADIDWTAVFDGLSRTENVAHHAQRQHLHSDERGNMPSPLAMHSQQGLGLHGHQWEGMFPPPPPVRTPGPTTTGGAVYAAVHETSSAASTPRSVEAGPSRPHVHRTESHPYSAPITPNHTGYNSNRGGPPSAAGDILSGLYLSPEGHHHHAAGSSAVPDGNRHSTAAHRELEERLRRISGRPQQSDLHPPQHPHPPHNALGANAFPKRRSTDPAGFSFPSPHDLLNPQSSSSSTSTWPHRPSLELDGSTLAGILGPTLSPGPHQSFHSTTTPSTAAHSPWGFNSHALGGGPGPSTLHLNQTSRNRDTLSNGSTPAVNASTPLQTVDDTVEQADQEDKRQRNTLASAKFRAKRKKHVETVQRRIGELEDEQTTLTREVSDLRNENKFLREMVELKYGLDVGPKKGVGTIKKGVGTGTDGTDHDDNDEEQSDQGVETAE